MIIALVLAPMLPMIGCVALISGMFSATFRRAGSESVYGLAGRAIVGRRQSRLARTERDG
jgi:hypothetical protein